MTNLTTFLADTSDAAAADLRVMRHHNRDGRDVGDAGTIFGARLALIEVGDSQGEDEERGAFDWWPLTIAGEAVGEMRDDATGLTIHVQGAE